MEVEDAEDIPKRLIIAITSDRGLSGATHSQVARRIKQDIGLEDTNTKFVCVGDKARTLLYR